MSLSEFYRRAARASAEEILAERSRITLDDDEATRFLEALTLMIPVAAARSLHGHDA